MALDTETITLDAERERLQDQMEDVAGKLVEWQHDPERVQEIREIGETIESQQNALAWAQDQWGVETLTFARLSEGERNYVDNFCEDHPDVADRVPVVAIGTHDAPFLSHDPEDIGAHDFDGAFEETVRTLTTEVPVPLIQWAEDKVTSLTHLDGETGNGFSELAQAKLRESREESGETGVAPSPSDTDTTQE